MSTNTESPGARAAQAPTVVPSLQRWVPQAGTTRIGGGFVVEHPQELADVARTLLADIADVTGLSGGSGAGTGAVPGLGYADFMRRSASVADWPGNTFLD